MSGNIKAVTQRRDVENFQANCDHLRKDGVFCDAFITIPGEKEPIPVHRVVLAACSSYFRSLFTWESEKSVKICGVSRKIMEMIVEYAYQRKVIVNAYNVEDLFAAADRFHVFGLQKECEEFLLDELSFENSVGIMNFFNSYNCDHGFKQSWNFIKQNFEDIAKRSQEFVQLEVDILKNIISNDEILVNDESEVFDAIRRWVDYNPSERQAFYPELFCLLRLVFINKDFFNSNILKDNILQENEVARNTVERARHLIDIIQTSGSTLVDLNETILRPRVPCEILFTVGGWSNKGVEDAIETFDKNVNSWFEGGSPMPHPRSYHATVAIGVVVYVIGGFDGRKYLNSVKCFYPETRTWEDRANMRTYRCYVAGTSVRDEIYACGGFDGQRRHDTVEKYHVQTDKWTLVQPMHIHRSDAGATSYNDRLFIAGGFDGHICLSSLEMYNPETNQWTLLQHMTTRRSGVSMVTLHNSMYAIGGYDGSERLPTVEQYDPRTNSWHDVADMRLGRSNFSAVVFDDKIYVIGGYDGSTTSNNVECYDAKTREWKKTCDLNIGRSAISACVLRSLSNARDFTFLGYFDKVEGGLSK